jgi:hypothetical protein
MNVRLQYDLDFLAGIYYDDRLQMNSYSVSMSLLTKTTDAVNTNIAMDRLKIFMHGELGKYCVCESSRKENVLK